MTTWLGTADTLVAGDTSALVTKFNNTARDAVKAVSEAWTAWTPVWTAATTNPTIGNGTIVGTYSQVGKLVTFKARITMGSTTTYGAGNYSISLPVALSANYVNNEVMGHGAAYDTSAALLYPLAMNKFGTTVFATGPAATTASPTIPFTWASGDILSFTGVYEAA